MSGDIRDDGMYCGASFSPDRLYRYSLSRIWGRGPTVAFIGLNPSTADEMTDDPTVRRCIRYAQDWGCGTMFMLNAFAFRATDPKVMKAVLEPVGPLNDPYLAQYARSVDILVCCWGVHGAHLNREAVVKAMLARLRSEASLEPAQVFGLTKDGHPKHPLYLPKTAQLEEWT